MLYLITPFLTLFLWLLNPLLWFKYPLNPYWWAGIISIWWDEATPSGKIVDIVAVLSIIALIWFLRALFYARIISPISQFARDIPSFILLAVYTVSVLSLTVFLLIKRVIYGAPPPPLPDHRPHLHNHAIMDAIDFCLNDATQIIQKTFAFLVPNEDLAQLKSLHSSDLSEAWFAALQLRSTVEDLSAPDLQISRSSDMMVNGVVQGMMVLINTIFNRIITLVPEPPKSPKTTTTKAPNTDGSDDQFDACTIISILDQFRLLFQQQQPNDAPQPNDLFVRCFGKPEVEILLRVLRQSPSKKKFHPKDHRKIQNLRTRALLLALRINDTQGNNPFIAGSLLDGLCVGEILSELSSDRGLIRDIHSALFSVFRTTYPRATTIKTFINYVPIISLSLSRNSNWIDIQFLEDWFGLLLWVLETIPTKSHPPLYSSLQHDPKLVELILTTRPDGAFCRSGLTILAQLSFNSTTAFKEQLQQKLYSDTRIISALNSSKCLLTTTDPIDYPPWIICLVGLVLPIALQAHPYLLTIILNTLLFSHQNHDKTTTSISTTPLTESPTSRHYLFSVLTKTISQQRLNSFPIIIQDDNYLLLNSIFFLFTSDWSTLTGNGLNNQSTEEIEKEFISTVGLFLAIVDVSFAKGASKPLVEVPTEICNVMALSVTVFRYLMKCMPNLKGETIAKMEAALFHFNSVPPPQPIPRLDVWSKPTSKTSVHTRIRDHKATPQSSTTATPTTTTKTTTTTTSLSNSATASATTAASPPPTTASHQPKLQPLTNSTTKHSTLNLPKIKPPTTTQKQNSLESPPTLIENRIHADQEPIIEVDRPQTIQPEPQLEPASSAKITTTPTPPFEHPTPKSETLLPTSLGEDLVHDQPPLQVKTHSQSEEDLENRIPAHDNSFKSPPRSASPPSSTPTTEAGEEALPLPFSSPQPPSSTTMSQKLMAAPLPLPTTTPTTPPPPPTTTATIIPYQVSLQQQKFLQRQLKSGSKPKTKAGYDEMD